MAWKPAGLAGPAWVRRAKTVAAAASTFRVWPAQTAAQVREKRGSVVAVAGEAPPARSAMPWQVVSRPVRLVVSRISALGSAPKAIAEPRPRTSCRMKAAVATPIRADGSAGVRGSGPAPAAPRAIAPRRRATARVGAAGASRCGVVGQSGRRGRPDDSFQPRTNLTLARSEVACGGRPATHRAGQSFRRASRTRRALRSLHLSGQAGQMMGRVAEGVLDHHAAAEEMAYGVFLGHADAAMQLDRLL